MHFSLKNALFSQNDNKLLLYFAGELGIEFKTFGGEAIGLFGFVRMARICKLNQSHVPSRFPVVVNKVTATRLLKAQIGYQLSARKYFLAYSKYQFAYSIIHILLESFRGTWFIGSRLRHLCQLSDCHIETDMALLHRFGVATEVFSGEHSVRCFIERVCY